MNIVRQRFQKIYQKIWNKSRKERYKAYPQVAREVYQRDNLKRNYGITPEQKKEMWLRQWKLCHICCRGVPTLRDDCVDHNHDTNEVRAILCGKCNKALGLLEENEQTILNMLDYVRTFREVA